MGDGLFPGRPCNLLDLYKDLVEKLASAPHPLGHGSIHRLPAADSGRLKGSGRPGGIRTPNPRIWSPVLYRSSYWPPLKANALRRYRGGVVRPPVACPAASLNLSVHDVLTTPPTIFLKLQTIRRTLFVLRRRIVSLLALGARQRNNLSHSCPSRFFTLGFWL